MKKTAFSIFLTFIFLSMFYQLNTFAEDTTQWRLPEGAKARLGKGSINEMAYSPNGTHLVVLSATNYDIKSKKNSEKASDRLYR